MSDVRSPPRIELPPAASSVSEHIGRTLRLAVPVMLGRAGLLILTLVDTAMTGHAGTLELAYYALAMAPQLTIMLIGIGSLLGTVILTAQADGAGRTQECGTIWCVAMLHALVYGLGLWLLSYAGEWFLTLTGQSADLARGGGEVLVMFAWSLPAMLLYVATTFFLEGINRPVPSMLVMLFANVLNVGLNWVLIYGHWGLSPMGAEGAALATSLVRWVMFLSLAIYVLLRIDRQRYGVVSALREPWCCGRKLRRIGYPTALTQGLESSAFSAMTLFAGWLGALQVAAFQVTMSLIALVFMFALGFSTAASVRIGNAVGRHDRRGIQLAGWVAVGLAVVVLSGCGVIFFSIPEYLVALYTSDAEVIVVATAAIALSALVLIPDGYQAVLMGALRGMADVWPATLLFFIAFWLVMMPAGYLFGVRWGGGAEGLVLAMLVGCMTAALLLTLRFIQVSQRPIRQV